MTLMVESSDDDMLKNSALPIAINKSEITNHSHAINAMILFFSLDDMDFYLNKENFVTTINEDGLVKLDLFTIYADNLAIEVWCIYHMQCDVHISHLITRNAFVFFMLIMKHRNSLSLIATVKTMNLALTSYIMLIFWEFTSWCTHLEWNMFD